MERCGGAALLRPPSSPGAPAATQPTTRPSQAAAVRLLWVLQLMSGEGGEAAGPSAARRRSACGAPPACTCCLPLLMHKRTRPALSCKLHHSRSSGPHGLCHPLSPSPTLPFLPPHPCSAPTAKAAGLRAGATHSAGSAESRPPGSVCSSRAAWLCWPSSTVECACEASPTWRSISVFNSGHRYARGAEILH